MAVFSVVTISVGFVAAGVSIQEIPGWFVLLYRAVILADNILLRASNEFRHTQR